MEIKKAEEVPPLSSSRPLLKRTQTLIDTMSKMKKGEVVEFAGKLDDEFSLIISSFQTAVKRCTNNNKGEYKANKRGNSLFVTRVG